MGSSPTRGSSEIFVVLGVVEFLIYSYFVATPPDSYIRKHFVLLFTEKVCPERASLVDDSQLPASEKTMDVDADASVSSKSFI